MRYIGGMLVLFLSLSFGCSPMLFEGRQIDSARLKQLTPGVSQGQKVEQLFGKPDSVENLGSGEQKYVYGYELKNRHWWTMDAVNKQRLEVILQDGVVQSYKLRTEGKEAILKE